MFDFDVVTGPTHGTPKPAEPVPAPRPGAAAPKPAAAEPAPRPETTDARRAA